MGISSYPNGWKGGVVVKGVPLEIPNPGKVFWVNNSGVIPSGGIGGSDSNDGTYLRPFSTIDATIGKCLENRGDVIYVMPGHSETITTDSAVDFDVAGVRCIGLGHGGKMAQINFNATAATVAVGADDVIIQNMRFTADVSAVVDGIVVEDGADEGVIRGCLFDVVLAATDEFVDSISFVNDNSRWLVEGCTFDMALGGAASAINMDADTDKLTIRKNVIRGDYSIGNIIGSTTLSTNLDIDNNLLENGDGSNLGAQPCIDLVGINSTGTIRNNYIVCNVGTKAASIVAAQCFLFENYYNEDITGTGGLIGTVSADD